MDFGPAWHWAAYASGPTLRDRRDDEQRGSPYDAKCNVAEIGVVNMGEIGAVRKRSRKETGPHDSSPCVARVKILTSSITNKANSILGLLRRNLRIPSQTIKTHAYQSLMRPHLEYASTVWDPHTHKNIYKLDIIQRRAARYTCNRWHNISSVTEMVGHLDWEPLATRRRNMRL